MKPEDQIIAIAEACGKSESGLIECVDGLYYEVFPYASKYCPQPFSRIGSSGWMRRIELPDYLNDLNAMHEAEETILRGDGWMGRARRFSDKLMRVVQDSNWVLWHADCVNCRYFSVHATAAQRAEAFLKTIGKWQESGANP